LPRQLPIYVINLKRDVQRLEQMKQQLEKLGLSWTRIEAVDGDEISPDEINKANRRATPRKLSAGEIGCLQSHVKIWRLLANQSEPAAVIMEDDIVMSSDLPKFINSGAWLPEGDCVVRLETFLMPAVLGKKPFEMHGRDLYQLRSLQYGCAAYIITKSRADRLLKEYNKYVDTADRFMFCTPSRNNVYQLSPALCIQRDIHDIGFQFHRVDSRIELERRHMIRKSQYHPVSFFLRLKLLLKTQLLRLFDVLRGYPVKKIPYM
jgi:glycosyl transferase family 25